MPSPQTVAYRKLIPLEIADVATIAGLWSALGLQATGSGLGFAIAASGEVVGVALFAGSFGLVMATAGAVVVGAGLLGATFMSDEQALHDLGEGVSQVHAFLSPLTQAAVALTAPIMNLLPTSKYVDDPYAYQKLAGAFGDAAMGAWTATSLRELGFSLESSAAGVPAFVHDFMGAVGPYLSPNSSSPNSQSGGAAQGIPGGSTAPFGISNGSGGQFSSGTGIYPFMPGLGDLGYGYSGSDASSSSSSEDGFTLIYSIGQPNPGGTGVVTGTGGFDPGTGTDSTGTGTGTDPTGTGTGTDPTGTGTGTDPTGTGTGTDPTGTGTGTDPTGTSTSTSTDSTDSTDPYDGLSSVRMELKPKMGILRGAGLGTG